MTDLVMKLLLTVFFSGLGLMLLVVGVREQILQHRALTGARPIQALIVSSRVVSSTTTSDSSSGSRSMTTHRPEVRFKYSIDGVSYESDMLRPTVIVRAYGSVADAAEELQPFAPGATVTAHVHPSQPQRAFLLAERSSLPTAFIAIGLVIIPLVGLAYRYVL